MMTVLYDASPLLVRYLIRLMTDGAPVAAHLFDQMAATAERFLYLRYHGILMILGT